MVTVIPNLVGATLGGRQMLGKIVKKITHWKNRDQIEDKN